MTKTIRRLPSLVTSMVHTPCSRPSSNVPHTPWTPASDHSSYGPWRFPDGSAQNFAVCPDANVSLFEVSPSVQLSAWIGDQASKRPIRRGVTFLIVRPDGLTIAVARAPAGEARAAVCTRRD